VADGPLDLVQIDHTQADVLVVDELMRKPLGRPWISVAIDVATRCVMGIYLALERPNAATVALLLTRVVLPKAPWLQSLGLDAQWPMNGIPLCLHLDNAAEFKSRALRTGCGQYGVELMYRPVGRPQFGGHVERLNRTLMERLLGLPGATGNSPKGRKERKPEQGAALTLVEFERWLVLEIAQRYHHSGHRGLMGATPASAWSALTEATTPRRLPPGPQEALRFLVHFLPLQSRTIQGDGLTMFYVRYWHPIFAAWREARRKVLVRYHPEDLSRVFVTVNGKSYVEARCADLRHPRISLWEQRQQGHRTLSEALVFNAIEEQRCIVERARSQARTARRKAPAAVKVKPSNVWAPQTVEEPSTAVDYSLSVEQFPVDIL
jgi:putative transposase